MDNLNELREELRNSQLESLKGLATTLLDAPLEDNYNLILISETKGNVQVNAQLGGQFSQYNSFARFFVGNNIEYPIRSTERIFGENL